VVAVAAAAATVVVTAAAEPIPVAGPPGQRALT
jgi:hypothetical protein